MSVYLVLPINTNFSQIVLAMDAQDEAIRSQERGAVAPGVKPDGLLWQSTDGATLTPLTNTQPGGAWPQGRLRWDASLGGGAGGWAVEHDTRYIALNNGGTVKLAANLNANNNSVVALRAAAAAGEAVRFEQSILTDGSHAFTGDQSMGNKELLDLHAPTHPNSAARLVDLHGLPIYPGWIWWQTNRDALGNGQPVVVEQNGDDTTYTWAGYVPRELTIRLWGEFRKQAGNGALAPPVTAQGWQATVRRYNADAVGGDPGTADEVLIGTIGALVNGNEVVDVFIRWKYFNVGPDANLGFYLKFKVRVFGPDTDHGYANLKKIGAAGTDGAIQAQAQFGVGT